jgi:malonyl-CoA/methylmalonyl-CoA synthetase
VHAWKYTPDDYLLNILPLHHIHGILNALLAPLFAGSSVEFMSAFNSTAVWERLATPYLPVAYRKTSCEEKVTFLTAVPTMYSHLVSRYQELPEVVRSAAQEAISPKNLRLNISGSAALPTPLKSSWTELSCGNVLLERYGMTEVGMALSCGLDFKDRVDGSVGWPLPYVEVRLVDIDTGEVIEPGQEIDKNGREREGEIQLRGPTIFEGYWHNPKASDEAFVQAEDGNGKWFKTGDIAIRKLVVGTGESEQEWAKGPMYFIKGRKSVDIIKTGGEKVSALEVERELLSL